MCVCVTCVCCGECDGTSNCMEIVGCSSQDTNLNGSYHYWLIICLLEVYLVISTLYCTTNQSHHHHKHITDSEL